MKPLFPITRWEVREVSKDRFVSYQGKQYSVPFRYVGKKVKVKETLNQYLEIYDDFECIAKHPLLIGQLRYHAQIEHYKGLNVTTNGLATRHTQPDALEVEQHSLQVYEQLEGGESQ